MCTREVARPPLTCRAALRSSERSRPSGTASARTGDRPSGCVPARGAYVSTRCTGDEQNNASIFLCMHESNSEQLISTELTRNRACQDERANAELQNRLETCRRDLTVVERELGPKREGRVTKGSAIFSHAGGQTVLGHRKRLQRVIRICREP